LAVGQQGGEDILPIRKQVRNIVALHHDLLAEIGPVGCQPGIADTLSVDPRLVAAQRSDMQHRMFNRLTDLKRLTKER
jgi:hypothetical protein